MSAPGDLRGVQEAVREGRAADQELRAGLLVGEHLPGGVQAPLLPLRHQPHCLLEPYQLIPQPCSAQQTPSGAA